jgi:hypothetical protein
MTSPRHGFPTTAAGTWCGVGRASASVYETANTEAITIATPITIEALRYGGRAMNPSGAWAPRNLGDVSS